MKIIKGKIPGAKKVVCYGPEGIGKSTLAARFPVPLFIDTEGSTKDMDVARTEPPSSWMMLICQVREVIAEPTLCKTLVIDTADWAEILCTNHICTSNQKTGIEDFGYGKGYVYLQEEFEKLLNLFTELVDDKGVNVVLTAHAKTRKFDLPDEMGSYDRWEMKMSKNVAPMVKEWADMVLFCNYKTIVVNVDGQGVQKGKNKAQGGKRVMYTTHHNCWDAKNRYGLPDECEFTYEALRNVIEDKGENQQQSPAKMTGGERLKEEKPKEGNFKKEELKAPNLPDFMHIQEDADEEVDFHTAAKNQIPEAFKVPEYIPKALRDLMEVNLVSEEELMEAVYKRGFFPSGTSFSNLPKDFIEGCLVGAWEKVLGVIKEIRSTYEIPFN